MAALTVSQIAPTGVVMAPVTPAGGGDTAVWSSDLKIYVKNASGGSINVTVSCGNPCSFGITGTAHDKVVAVAASAEKVIAAGEERFRDGSGNVNILCSATASVTVAAVRG